MIFWALVIVVTIKYIPLIMRAPTTAAKAGYLRSPRWFRAASSTGRGGAGGSSGPGVFGAAMFYGDGMITPAPHPFMVPVAVAILVALFMIQRHGTARIGLSFGPMMGLWFATLAVLGAREIAELGGVLWALDPAFAVGFITGLPRGRSGSCRCRRTRPRLASFSGSQPTAWSNWGRKWSGSEAEFRSGIVPRTILWRDTQKNAGARPAFQCAVWKGY